MIASNNIRRFPAAVRVLARAGQAAPSADNLQPIAFAYRENMLAIRYRPPEGPTFPAWHPATLMAAGAATENVAQAAAAMGVSTKIEVMASGGVDYARIEFDDVDKAVLRHDQSFALFARHTNRHPYRVASIEERVQVQLGEFSEDGARIRLLGEPDRIRAFGALTRTASKARFQTPEIHAWFAASLRFDSTKAVDGLDIRTLHLPTGGRLVLRYIADWRRMAWLNRFGAYRALAATEARPIHQAPLLVSVISNDPFTAGRLMERLWIKVNAEGLAAQPFYVVPDQMRRLREGSVPAPLLPSIEAMSHDVKSLLGLAPTESLFIVLRVGLPTIPAVRSARLPLERVLSVA